MPNCFRTRFFLVLTSVAFGSGERVLRVSSQWAPRCRWRHSVQGHALLLVRRLSRVQTELPDVQAALLQTLHQHPPSTALRTAQAPTSQHPAHLGFDTSAPPGAGCTWPGQNPTPEAPESWRAGAPARPALKPARTQPARQGWGLRGATPVTHGEEKLDTGLSGLE